MNKIEERKQDIIRLGNLLKERRNSKNLSLRKVEDYFLQKGIKLTHTSIKKIEEGNINNLDIRYLKGFVELYNLSFNEVFGLAGIDLKELSRIMKLKEEDNMKKILLFGQASAGNGFINLDVEIGNFSIPEEDYREGYFGIKVVGKSMIGDEGNIPNGSVALVNPNCGELMKSKIYVFTYKEETYIKQLVFDKQGIMRLHSFNKEYEDVIVLDKEELICNGRVIKIYFDQEL